MWERILAAMAVASFALGFGGGVLLEALKEKYPDASPVLLWILLSVGGFLVVVPLAVVVAYVVRRIERKKCGQYLAVVRGVLGKLQQKLTLAAGEIGRERDYQPTAQDKLRPIVTNVEQMVSLITTNAEIMRTDYVPEVPELLRSIALHTRTELVTPFHQPIDFSQANAIEKKVNRASWSVACAALLTAQLVDLVAAHPRYPRRGLTRYAGGAPGRPVGSAA